MSQRWTTEVFITRARAVHGDKYDYSQVVYRGAWAKVKIICPNPVHGAFEQMASMHLSGHGCSTCCESQGERSVAVALEKLGTIFERQARLIEERKGLRFDFHLPAHRVVIEYNGVQHYQPVAWFGGKKAHKQTRRRDRFKKTWARRNGYRLITIPYTIRNITGFLTRRLTA